MNIEALREAVERLDAGRDPWHLSADEQLALAAAARAVLDSEQIWWCNASRAEWPEDDEFGEYCAHDRERGCGFVFVVRRLLAEEGT